MAKKKKIILCDCDNSDIPFIEITMGCHFGILTKKESEELKKQTEGRWKKVSDIKEFKPE